MVPAPITTNLVKLLTQDKVIDDEQTIKNYLVLIENAFGSSFKKIEKTNLTKIQQEKRKLLITELRNSTKFTEFIAGKFEIKPVSYQRSAVGSAIFIHPNLDSQVDRLKVLYGSLVAQNNNPDTMNELSAILDSLYKSKKIDKKSYKHIYYQAKNLFELNGKNVTRKDQ